MLKRFVFVALLGFLLLPAVATPAQADGGCKEQSDARFGSVDVVCSGGGGKGSKGGGSGDGSGAPSAGSGGTGCVSSRETMFRAVMKLWVTGQMIRKDGAIQYPTSHPKTIRCGKDTPMEESIHAYDPKTGLTKE